MSTVWFIAAHEAQIPMLQTAAALVREFGLETRVTVAAAHRSPDRVRRLIQEAEAGETVALICTAGGAAHLAGLVAAETILPVIGIPAATTPLNGMDALLATVQMPAGVPVACMALGEPGAINAAVLAVQIAAVGNPTLSAKLRAYKARLAEDVESQAARIEG